MESIPELIVGAVIFAGGAYIGSLFKERAKKEIELDFVKEITQKTEEVKLAFNTEIQKLSQQLNRENIAFQINQAELAKIRFQKFEALYIECLDLRTMANKLIHWPEKDQQEKKMEYQKKNYELWRLMKEIKIFINDDTYNKMIEFTNAANKLMIHTHLYHTAINSGSSINRPMTDQEVNRSTKQWDEIEKVTQNLDELLYIIEGEIKKYIGLYQTNPASAIE